MFLLWRSCSPKKKISSPLCQLLSLWKTRTLRIGVPVDPVVHKFPVITSGESVFIASQNSNYGVYADIIGNFEHHFTESQIRNVNCHRQWARSGTSDWYSFPYFKRPQVVEELYLNVSPWMDYTMDQYHQPSTQHQVRITCWCKVTLQLLSKEYSDC